MGCCFSSKAKAELLIRDLKHETDMLHCAESELISFNGNIRDVQKPEDMKKLEIEYDLSLSNLKKISSLFPNLVLALDKSLPKIEFCLPIARVYTENKLKISELLKKLIIELDFLTKKLKSIESHKNHINNSTIETLELLLTQESFTSLKSELQEVKLKQIELSSYRGGSLHSLLCRIESRCKISKELELIQAKIESEQYLQNLENIVCDSEDLNEELAELVDKKKNNEEMCRVLQEKMQEKHKNEVEPANEKLADLEKIIRNTQSEIKCRKSIKASKTNKVEEIARMNVRLSYSESEIHLLSMKFSELTKEFEVFSQISKATNRVSKKVNTREMNLKELMNQLHKLNNEKDAGFEVNGLEKDERTIQLEKSLKEVTKAFTEIDKNLEVAKERRKVSLQRQIALRFFQSFKEQIEYWLWKWKTNKIYRSIDSSIQQQSYYLDGLDEEDFKAADQFIATQKEIILNSDHCLMKFTDFQGVKPLDVNKLFKFLEEMMDKKYEIDLKDINDGMLPMSFPDFVYNFIIGIFGIQKSAERHICRILLTLKNLAAEKSQYAKFFCQLFQVFSPDPIFYDFSIFLTRTRYDFQSIIYKLEKKVLSQGQKIFKISKNKPLEILLKGGLASLSDAVDLLICIFEQNKALGMLALQKIKPSKISLEEFIAFLICQKVARMNMSIESIFFNIDKDSSYTIDLKELTTFIRTSMDLWISESDLEACFMNLVKPGTKEISHDVFVSTFSMDFFTRANENEKYLVSKVEFLTVLLDIYSLEYRKEAAWIFALMSFYPEAVSRGEFNEIIVRIDSSFAGQVDSLYFDVTQVNGKVKRFDLVELILKKGIGNWKRNAFSMNEVINGLRERNDTSFRRSFMCYSSSDVSRFSLDNSEIN